MADIKTGRNKTIDMTVEDGRKYLERCISIENSVNSFDTVLDKTIIGDTFDVMSHLPEKCADLMIADPPYNRNKSFGTTRFSKKETAEYEDYTRHWLQLAYPLIKDGGSVYVCCDWESSLVIGRVLGEFFDIRNRITWQREKGRGAMSNWKNGMEDIWFASKGNGYKFNLDAVKLRRRVLAPYKDNGKAKDWTETADGKFRDTCPSNFWDDITVPFWSMSENTAHPTQKPEKLIAKMILASSDKGDTVFDPFLGSGTTSVTAKKLGRHYIGIEKEAQYCIWTEKRLEMADSDDSIQGYSDGVFYERNTIAGKQTAKK